MKREPGMAYDTKKLNKIFAILSVVFLISVLWLFLDDYIRPWKAVQIKGLEIKREFLARELAEADKSIDQKELKSINEEISNAQKIIDNHSVELSKYKDELQDIQKQIVIQNMKNGEYGSMAGEWQFKYEHDLVAKSDSSAESAKRKMEHYKELFSDGKDNLKDLNLKEAKVKTDIASIENKKEVADKKLKVATGVKDRLLTTYAQNEQGFIWMLRNAPFLNFMDPTIKIHQTVLSNITDDRYFKSTEKVDRCVTCHVFIDQEGFEKQANPYKTHPNIHTVAVGADSPHPMKTFGCTTCHGGEGHRVNDFNTVAHTPQNQKQKEEWVEKYGWKKPHNIIQPMIPLQYTEGACIKCHQGQDRLVGGSKLNKGRELIENFGCNGCHKIESWNNLKKPGPSLEKISAKTSKEFIKNWIWSPHSFNSHSRMPAFFNQRNNSSPEFVRLGIAEVNSMAEYIYKKSKSSEPIATFVSGNSDKGKELIQTIGCVGCHQVEGIDAPYSDVKSLKGPYLTGTGSKVNPDWLVSWLLKPSHYQADTIMPSFRLSNGEANDIATYLLSLKNKTFEKLQFEPLDSEAMNELLVDYFSAFEPKLVAQKKVSALTYDEKVMELGKRSLNKYGCYSCHNIDGFGDDLPPIGPELTKIGSKPLGQLGWGHEVTLDKTRHNWIWHHLQAPARWDEGVPKVYKDLTRMPNFYLSDDQITLITGYLTGLVSETVPLTGKKLLNANEQIAEDGKKVITKYNCQGCHVIDGLGGTLAEAYKDDANIGPPYLVREGERVQSEWLYHFLKGIYPIRDYLSIRMPSFNFSNEELNKIIAYFQMEAHQDAFIDNSEKIIWESGEKEAAQKIFTELACASCHTTGFNKEKSQAPDLHQVKLRLRSKWIEHWLTNPQAILPYTPMPNFWDGGKASAVPGVLGDDPKAQIRAVTKYLLEMSESQYPNKSGK